MRAVELKDGRHVMAIIKDDIKPDLSTVSTRDLQEELSRREGVKTLPIGHDDHASITVTRVNDDVFDIETQTVTIVGNAIITVNID